ncbi:MAG: U32 family peptidase [Lachnospiraceae bacterium]|nr:U32 family peptidase [Lachnospiraceae bacterium]
MSDKTTKKNKKPELLCPASSLEVLKCAVRYGADAVYIGGESYGLRAKAKNFSPEEMAEGIRFAHEHGARVHVAVNILAHNYDLEGAAKYFEELKVMKPDALIVADPGMYSICREVWPEAEIHISTQANNTNYATFNFWYKQGAKRVVSARELSLREIKEIREKIPEDMEIESFVHGAMCISYSGRCLLSNYFTGRDANKGACTHPCRWKYNLYENADSFMNEENGELHYAIEEESRPGEYLPVYENERGTYIFNSRDLCMIEHIPDLINAGIDSWKIEGRMKTALYVATVARTYRRAIDDYFESPEKYEANLPWYREQISKCTYRKFSTGFFFGKPDENSQIYDNNTYMSESVFLAIVDKTVPQSRVDAGNNGSSDAEKDNDRLLAGFTQKNKFSVGDEIEIMKPDGRDIKVKVLEMYHVCDGSGFEKDEKDRVIIDGNECIRVTSCPHAEEKVYVRLSEDPEAGDILRTDPAMAKQ